MANWQHHRGDPGGRRIAFGTLTGLVSGFVVTLAVSLVVLGTTGAQSGLRLSIPGRHPTEQDSPDGAPSTTIPTFEQSVPAVTVVPVASVSSPAGRTPATAAAHRTPSRVPATAGYVQTAVPGTLAPSTTGTVAVPVAPPSATVPPAVPTAVEPTVATTEPDPPAATPATPAPTETASAAAVAR